MHILQLVPLAALFMLLLAATCIANVEQKGPEGPWVGEVVNMGEQTIHGGSAYARIYDANNVELHGLVGVPACPSRLLPGERGAFELFEDDPSFFNPPDAPAQPRIPFRADFYPTEHPPIGTGALRGDGLLVREIERHSARQVLRVELTNNSGFNYAEVGVCAVLRDESGKVLEVASAAGPSLPATLFPRESFDLELPFNSLPVGNIRLYAAGLWNAPYTDCCPVNGPSAWFSVKNQNFSVLLPPGWAYEPLQGIDTFVGRYYGDGVELNFDYGIYSDPLNYEGDASYEVREETIGGLTAKIVRADGPRGVTGVHFASVGKFSFPGDNIAFDVRLTITGQDLTPAQQAIALQIFRSIRFPE